MTVTPAEGAEPEKQEKDMSYHCRSCGENFYASEMPSRTNTNNVSLKGLSKENRKAALDELLKKSGLLSAGKNKKNETLQ